MATALEDNTQGLALPGVLPNDKKEEVETVEQVQVLEKRPNPVPSVSDVSFKSGLETATDDDDFADARSEASSRPPSPPPIPPSRSLARQSQVTISSHQDSLREESRSSSPDTERMENDRYSGISLAPVDTSKPTANPGSDGAASIKSPLERKISTESLDEVSLMDEPPATTITTKDQPPPAAEDDSDAEMTPTVPTSADASSNSSILNRFSRSSTSSQATAASTISKQSSITPATGTLAKLASNFTTPAPTPAPAAAAPAPVPPPPPPPPPPVRRSPFSWLRSSSQSNPPKDKAPSVASTPAASRRQTNSSIMTTTSEVTTGTDSATQSKNTIAEDMAKGAETLKENFRKIKERELTGATTTNGLETVPKQSVLSSIVAGAGLNMAAPTPDSSSSTPESEDVQEDPIDWDLWQSIVEDPSGAVTASPEHINSAIQAGIPQTIRGTVWQALAQSKSLELEDLYKEVLALPQTATADDARTIFGKYSPLTRSSLSSNNNSPKIQTPPLGSPKATPQLPLGGDRKTVAQLEKTIRKDLGDRTSFGKYKVDQKALLNICKAYALFDPEVGYTQGMTFVATVLLLNMSEEEAFCLFVSLMGRFDLRSMFRDRMKGLELRLYQYDRILEDFEPRLAIHLRRQGIESSLYAAQWFITLFTYKFPLQLVVRVFDLVFSEGLEAAILKFGIVMMQKNAEALLQMDFESLGPFLKERLFDVYLDLSPSANNVKEAGFFGNGGEKDVYRANALVQDACALKITPQQLSRYESEWTDAERIKRDTELELEMLRNNNGSLQSRVKRLEDELNELNTEHVALANEMVVKKVENAHLAEENEALAYEVEELKKVVSAQPQEVEDRLRSEMDRILKRNLEVHEEMQQFEEQAAEMEKELINTKMELATVNESYELLKTRWNELKKSLND